MNGNDVSAPDRERLAKATKAIKPVPHGAATELTADVYQHLQADFLSVPLPTALAYSQVDTSVIEDFQSHCAATPAPVH